jgi:hypothetical protein
MKSLKAYSFCLILSVSQFSMANDFIEKHVKEGKSFNQSMHEIYLNSKYQSYCGDRESLKSAIRCRITIESKDRQSMAKLNRQIFNAINSHNNHQELMELRESFGDRLTKKELDQIDVRIKELEYMGE